MAFTGSTVGSNTVSPPSSVAVRYSSLCSTAVPSQIERHVCTSTLCASLSLYSTFATANSFEASGRYATYCPRASPFQPFFFPGAHPLAATPGGRLPTSFPLPPFGQYSSTRVISRTRANYVSGLPRSAPTGYPRHFPQAAPSQDPLVSRYSTNSAEPLRTVPCSVHPKDA